MGDGTGVLVGPFPASQLMLMIFFSLSLYIYIYMGDGMGALFDRFLHLQARKRDTPQEST